MTEVNRKAIDFDRVEKLLGIVEKVATVAPRLTHILSVANDELVAINDAIDLAAMRDQPLATEPLTDADPTKPTPDPELQRRLEEPELNREHYGGRRV